jgi:hypothetical protein
MMQIVKFIGDCTIVCKAEDGDPRLGLATFGLVLPDVLGAKSGLYFQSGLCH